MTLATGKDFHSGWRTGRSLRGWALAEQGQGEAGHGPDTPGAGRLTGPPGPALSQPYWLAPTGRGLWDK